MTTVNNDFIECAVLKTIVDSTPYFLWNCASLIYFKLAKPCLGH